MAAASTSAVTERSIIAGVLTWVVPGAGHWYLGQRGFATVFFVAITLPYLSGVAIGGVKANVNPHANKWLFVAEMGIGSYAAAFYGLNLATSEITMQQAASIHELNKLEPAKVRQYISFYPESEVAQIYLAAAGLLNLLAILDAITRAQQRGEPLYYHELPPASESGSSS
jgi:hypothetical protein